MRSFWETLLRNLTWFVLATVLVPALAGAVGYYYLRAYEASAIIWVEPQATPSTGDPWKPKTAADLYAGRLGQLLLTRSFREDVLNEMSNATGLPIAGEVERTAMLNRIGKDAKVAVRGAYLIDVRFRDDDPVIAQQTTIAIVDAFQRETLALKTQAAQRVTDLYQAQLQRAREELAAAESREVDPREFQSRVDLLRTLEERRNEAYGTGISGTLALPGTLLVIDEARLPERRSANTMQLLLGIVAALTVTLLSELGIIALLTLSDRSVRNVRDVGGLTAAPTFEMPRVKVETGRS